MPEAIKELFLELKAMPGSGLWTGDADMGMSYIKATSILGGLRFWTEALLRSLGEHVCYDTRCLHGSGRTCAACGIFGCTGLSREFSLNVIPERKLGQNEAEGPDRVYPGQGGRPAHYRFRNGYRDKFTLAFAAHRPPLGGGAPSLPGNMLAALALMIEYGTLGAQDQYGCGLMSYVRNEDRELLLKAASIPENSVLQSSPGLSLQDFFFFKGSVRNAMQTGRDSMGISLDIRRAVREEARKLNNDRFRHWFCGSLQSDQSGLRFAGDSGRNNSGSKFSLAVTSDGMLYGWGHFSRHFPHELSGYAGFRDPMLNAMKNVLAARVDALQWKEFSSNRDTCESPKDWTKYLAGMLDSRWR